MTKNIEFINCFFRNQLLIGISVSISYKYHLSYYINISSIEVSHRIKAPGSAVTNK